VFGRRNPKEGSIVDQKVKEGVDQQRDVAKKFLESGELKTATTYTYSCQVSIAAGGGGFLNVDFKNGTSFSGGFGGGVGAYTGWGTAWCNKKVEDMKGKSAGFVVEVVGVLGGTAHVQIASAPDNFIGNCSTGGIGIGGGIGYGGGKFS
jgi:hypothetical protein